MAGIDQGADGGGPSPENLAGLLGGIEALRDRLNGEVDRLDVWLRAARNVTRPDTMAVSLPAVKAAAQPLAIFEDDYAPRPPLMVSKSSSKADLKARAEAKGEMKAAATGASQSAARSGTFGHGAGGDDAGSVAPTHFVDHEDHKAQLEARSISNKEALASQSKSRHDLAAPLLKRIVAGAPFEFAVAIAVLANAVLIGAEVQHSAKNIGQESPKIFYFLQHTFTVIFIAELAARIRAFGFYKLFVKDGFFCWPWFDVVVVSSALIEMVLDGMYLAGGSKVGMSGVSQLRMGRVIKVTRLVRTLRVQRIIRLVAPLRTLVFSVMVTLNSLLWAMALLFLIIYVVAIAIVQVVTDFRADGSVTDPTVISSLEFFWSDLFSAMHTCFQSISGGVSWRDPALALDNVSPPIFYVFTLYICFICFAVLNVVTGVFCSSAIETTQRNPEVIAAAMISSKREYERNLRQLFDSVDLDGSGLITLGELEQILDDEMMNAHLVALEIDVNDAWTLFRLIDVDKSGVIELDEFVEGCKSLRGNAKGIDMATTRTELKNLSRQIYRFAQMVEGQFEVLTGTPCLRPVTGRASFAVLDESERPQKPGAARA